MKKGTTSLEHTETMKNDMKNKIIFAILLTTIFASLLGMATIMATFFETARCLQWKEYAVEHPTIVFDQWQTYQCTKYSITLKDTK